MQLAPHSFALSARHWRLPPSESAPVSQDAAAASQAGVHATTNPLKNANYGEQHVHTAYSLDAFIGGA